MIRYVFNRNASPASQNKYIIISQKLVLLLTRQGTGKRKVFESDRIKIEASGSKIMHV